MTGLWLKLEVWGVQSEKEWWKYSPLWCSCAADHLVWHTILQSHKLWSVCQVVIDPGDCWGLHLCLLEILTKQIRLNCVKCTGEIKEHDPRSAACFVQMTVGWLKQVDDGVFNANSTTISELQGVLICSSLLTQVGQQESLQDLHDEGCQGNRSIVVDDWWVTFLLYWNKAGCLPQHWNLLG